MRRALLLSWCVAALPVAASAQSSQFGVRGVGLPARGLSTRATATGGGFGIFDAESSVNPAALSSVSALTATFTALQEFRSTTNAAGSGNVRETRFPQLAVSGPIKGLPLVLSASFSTYSNRDYSVAGVDTLLLRGVRVGVADTLVSRGGLSNIRIGAAYRTGAAGSIGIGVHIISGSDRAEARRTFSDTLYLPVRDRTELSSTAVGFSVGTVQQLSPALSVAAVVRTDGPLRIYRDSTRVGRLDLPWTFGGGVHFRASPRLDLATQATYRTWTSANADLAGTASLPASNTVELSLGGEYLTDPRRPGRRPLRFGVRYGTLAFPLTAGARPHELGVAVGTGIRFARQRDGLDHAGLDLTLEHVSRSDGTGRSERAWLLSFGVTLRP